MSTELKTFADCLSRRLARMAEQHKRLSLEHADTRGIDPRHAAIADALNIAAEAVEDAAELATYEE